MIGSVRGTVIERGTAGEVVVEVGGVGYRLFVPVRTVPDLLPGESTFLFTHLHVREDAMVLYGFSTRDDRNTFEVLIGASGVGPKLALAMLSCLDPVALRRALFEDDLEALTAVPGVGKRTAQRLVVELKSRLDVPDIDITGDAAKQPARAEVREALSGLGYGPDEIRAVLNEITDDLGVEDLLRTALRRLAVAR